LGHLPFVSVIVPVYRDWASLAQCLDALSRQSYPQTAFEVIVANNDPRSEVPPAVRERDVRILDQKIPGSYAARNKAVEHASGEILAFTDSDCTPAEDWLERGVDRLLHGSERLAGRVVLTFGSDRLTWAEIYEKAYAFRQEENAAQGTSVTANLLVWRRIFERVGPFDATLLSRGDTEWGLRASAAGVGIDHAPDVVVYHPARTTLRELLAKRRRLAGGAFQLAPPTELGPVIVRSLRGLMPPAYAYRSIRGRADLSSAEKAVAFLVRYLIKVYSTFQRLLLSARLRKPVRS